MVELELLGLHGDGEHLTLTDEEGRRYRLAIDDTLRAAVRRDRPQLEQLRAAGESALRPKEIQALIRAGASVDEVAEVSGLPVENVRRYESPVVAERGWVVQQAQAQRIGHEADAPRLGELVVDRLAARGVPGASVEWDAVRRQGEPWEVVVTFVAGGREREARWQLDLTTRSLHAVDDEARWLSETEVGPGAAPRRHLSPVIPGRGRSLPEPPAAPPAPVEAPAAVEPEEPVLPAGNTTTPGSATDTLLAELAAHRGTRLDLQPELDLDLEDDAPGAHPPASRPEEATDAHVLSLPRRETPAEGPGTTPALPADEAPAEAKERNGSDGAATADTKRGAKNRRTRRSVPSWDEIVFGARPE